MSIRILTCWRVSGFLTMWSWVQNHPQMWDKTTPNPPFWPFLTPGVVLCHSGVVLSPLLGGLSPQRGGFIPTLGHGGGITLLWWFYHPFSVILSVNLEPQYRKTSCFRSICCALRRTPLGMGAGACPISISGMEVGEVTEERHMVLHSVFCFTLLFTYVL